MRAPTMIRYHPKALKPYLVTKPMKNLMASNATMNATALPINRGVKLSVMICMATLANIWMSKVLCFMRKPSHSLTPYQKN